MPLERCGGTNIVLVLVVQPGGSAHHSVAVISIYFSTGAMISRIVFSDLLTDAMSSKVVWLVSSDLLTDAVLWNAVFSDLLTPSFSWICRQV